MKNFSSWLPNYKFGYIAAWAALLLCVIAIVFMLVTGEGSGTSMFFAGVMVVNAAILVVMMPRWALDGELEQERRRKAQQAREELRGRR